MAKIKINTFVSKFNVDTIPEMVPLIARLGPSRWSLYQYWPLSHGKTAITRHSISDEQFSTMIEKLPATIDGVLIEVNPLSVRRLTYPFVSHDGTIYIHDETDDSSYRMLGPIFDDNVITELFARCGVEREESKSRYASHGGLGKMESKRLDHCENWVAPEPQCARSVPDC